MTFLFERILSIIDEKIIELKEINHVEFNAMYYLPFTQKIIVFLYSLHCKFN